MPLKTFVCLHPMPPPELEEEEPEIVEEEGIFDPEAGTASDNPFDDAVGIEKEEIMEVVLSYEDMTVKDLKGILRQRKLPIKGTKGDLIARLETSDTAAADASSVSDEEAPEESAASDKGVSEYGKQPVIEDSAEET